MLIKNESNLLILIYQCYLNTHINITFIYNHYTIIKQLEMKLVFCLCSPPHGIHHDGVRLVDHSRDQSFPMKSVHLSDFDDITTRISPVQVSSHPINRNTTRHFQIRDLKRARNNNNNNKCIKGFKQPLVLVEMPFNEGVNSDLQIGDPLFALSAAAVGVG